MIDLDELERLAEAPGGAEAELTDIEGFVPEGDTPEQRLESLLRQVGNPYLFRVGKTKVRLTFTGGATLEERLRQYLAGPAGEV